MVRRLFTRLLPATRPGRRADLWATVYAASVGEPGDTEAPHAD